MNIKKILTITLLLCTTVTFAQEVKEEAKVVFKPHWFLQAQGGIGYTVGEGNISDLISPAIAGNIGYNFNPVFGLRIGASAWQAKGVWVSPKTVYKFKYLQGNIDALFDLSTLFCKYNPYRVFNGYGFLGIGVNYAFDNDQAVTLNNNGDKLKNLWDGHKILPIGRMGLGTNIRISNNVFFNLEINGNIISDKFNSKKAGNPDWQFNALGGFTFKFGKTYTKTETVYYEPSPAPTPAVKEEPKPAVIVKETPKKQDALTENIFFIINSSKIRSVEDSKIINLVDYLNKYPESKVTITGYADKDTGTSKYNDKLSKMRADSVAKAIKAKGISEDRVIIEYKGSEVQPFSVNDKNRVSICVAE